VLDAVDAASAAACTKPEDCAAQSADKCVLQWACDTTVQPAVCKPETVVKCAPVNKPCEVNACAAARGECAAMQLPEGAGCSDGNGCTLGETCQQGVCKGGVAKPCDDGNPCTKDECDPFTAACAALPNAATCSDGDACTVADLCGGGACKPGFVKNCDDFNPCTQDKCDPLAGTCANLPAPATCTDHDPCTVGDKGDKGDCKPLGTKDCDDGKPCTKDACDLASGACTNLPTQAPCDDNNPCTVGDLCDGGKCGSGAAKNCDDGNACTQGDACKNGMCKAGAAKVCDDGNPCTADACDTVSGACSAQPIVGCGGNGQLPDRQQQRLVQRPERMHAGRPVQRRCVQVRDAEGVQRPECVHRRQLRQGHRQLRVRTPERHRVQRRQRVHRERPLQCGHLRGQPQDLQ
jgi:hypothetical protein